MNVWAKKEQQHLKGARIDNAVFYCSPTFAGTTVQLAVPLNESYDEDFEWTNNKRFWGGSVDWKGGNFGLMIGVEQDVLVASDKAENNGGNPTSLFLGASYDFGFMKLMAGYQRAWDLTESPARTPFVSAGSSGG
ncbi:MAG: porin [Sutterellaceae bacterium]|nr:porin [Sutterellaceae bacterium]